ncbi:hypothetical protein K504DRAFT_460436 [Pleomassaria siparia CBS 279.74]|uniref:Uncharacterized protein n=1 Tax=Pleomassaria siparia CBS 279.74 TaxID=1314801 RepID=A0A6G1JXF9_9PLEO|nr:hypothetical protein K504DRAFT_460436 [Pleomassaria siparia CBS 279.74]
MFKTRIIRRSFSLFNRAQQNTRFAQNAARHGYETVQVQRVRFRKPLFSRSKLIRFTIGASGTYASIGWLDYKLDEIMGPKRETEKVREKRARRDKEKDPDDAGEPLIFLPTGLSREKPRSYYKGSDPEWQEFVKIAPDRVRLQRIRGELVSIVRNGATKNPQYASRLGKINLTAGMDWLEFKFPDGPPAEFERPGIELTEDGIVRKTTRPVNQLIHHRLDHIFMPTAAAKSLYVDAERKLRRSWRDFKVYMGWEEKRKIERLRTTTSLSRLPTNPQAPTSTTASTTPPPSSPTAPTPNSQQPQPPTSVSPPSKESAPSTEPPDPVYERFGLALPKPTALTLDLTTFRQAFHREQHLMNDKLQPPRGTFIVSGLIEIIGDKAKMTLDVFAAYDPKVGKFVMLKPRTRSYTPYSQRPRGGH